MFYKIIQEYSTSRPDSLYKCNLVSLTVFWNSKTVHVHELLTAGQ